MVDIAFSTANEKVERGEKGEETVQLIRPTRAYERGSATLHPDSSQIEECLLKYKKDVETHSGNQPFGISLTCMC